VVLQHNRFNQSAIGTVVLAVITSNLGLAGAPGNVRLRKGDGGLPRPSVVNVSQLKSVDRVFIRERLGQLSRERLLEIWAGVRLVMEAA
jgi:mRNA interferase MazF